ncbi:MAG: hypothetical protein DMF67_13395 [Acidobacteria bacterium]|nr:MAG: hypothetical protein DMF66_18720 [Acidobacteriota bacterium]PYS82317.1 MAG: hypothetical protein DMF67_13395 [Acidobacteriota bacterium]
MNLLFSILLTVGLVLVVASVAVGFNEYWFISHGTVADGTVVENVRQGRGYAPRISFRTHEGKEAFFTPVYSSNPPFYDKGDTVKIVYRGQGEGARVLTFASRFGLAWPLMCAGLALVVIALGFKYGDAYLVSHYARSAAPFGR